MSPETDVVELSTPLLLPCGRILPNRVMKAALSEGLGTAEHAPGTRLETLYRRWGAGGYGLVVTGNVMIDRSHLGEPGNVVIEDDRDRDALARWAKSISDGGVPIWVQLNHPGRQANPIVTRATPVAPSAIASGVPGLPTPRALSEKEIRDIIDRFAVAASVAEAAGFDGVQIHGAHGYLVSQFLSPLSNRREDAWGGDLDGRMRFVLHVVRAIRAAVSPGFAVGIKLNSADFQRGGFSEEESRITVEHLAEEAIDLIEVSGGSYESPAMMGTSSTRDREAYFLEYARTVRDAAGSVPLAVTGGFRTRSVMNAAVRSRECDVVGLGRPTALAPAVARSLVDGSLDQVETPRVALRVPSKPGAFKQINGALDLQWHTDQLQLIGEGGQPDSGRPAWRTAAKMLQRNGWDAFRNRRASGNAKPSAATVKFRRERWIGKHIANPLVNGLTSVGLRTSLVTDIETVGRRSGMRRQVPVSASFDRTGAWLISQHGTRSGWGANISEEPGIRIRVGNRWRTATATFVPEDDVDARARSFSANPVLGRLIGRGFRALRTDPMSVRIEFTDHHSDDARR